MIENSQGPGQTDCQPRLLDDLETVREQIWRTQVLHSLVRFCLNVVGLLAVLALADWMWVLSASTRGLVLIGAIGLAIVVLVRSWPRIDRTHVALAVEHEFTELGQRVRTVLEFAHPGPETVTASPGMVKALIHETDERTSGLDYQRVVPWRKLKRGLTLLGLMLLPVMLGLAFSPGLRTAGLRVFQFRAHYTTLKVEPGDAVIRAGEPLNVGVTLAGRPVRQVRWLRRKTDSSETWMASDLGPTTPAPHSLARPSLIGQLTTSLANCQNDLDYRVEAGELQSPVYHVRIVHPLTLLKFEATVIPPSYTRRPKAVEKQGNLRVIEGSEVHLAIDLNREPRTGALELSIPGEPSPRTIPLSIHGTRLTGVMASITSEQPYTIVAQASDGEELDRVAYQIKVQPDEPPSVRFIRPEEDLGVIATAEVPIEVAAGDDFGVARVGIAYKLANGPEESLYLRDHPEQPPTVRAMATLYLEKHKLTYTDEITYYAFVEDNHPIRPHRVISELRFIDILPYKQAFQYVEGGGT